MIAAGEVAELCHQGHGHSERHPPRACKVLTTGFSRHDAKYFVEHFDETLSDFCAGSLVDFFVKELGPPVYNQAIRDVYTFIHDQLTDPGGRATRQAFSQRRVSMAVWAAAHRER